MVIIVTKLKSTLRESEVRRLLDERSEEFHDVTGLVHTYYCREYGTGALCGVFLFQSREVAEMFLHSGLARLLDREFHAMEPARLEKYEVLETIQA